MQTMRKILYVVYMHSSGRITILSEMHIALRVSAVWCMHLIDPIYLALEMQTVRSRISYVICANCAQRNQSDSAT